MIMYSEHLVDELIDVAVSSMPLAQTGVLISYNLHSLANGWLPIVDCYLFYTPNANFITILKMESSTLTSKNTPHETLN